MKREIILNGRIIEYELEYKKVKNINLRVTGGRVYVSLNRWITEKTVEAFMISKADLVLKAIDRVNNAPLIQYFTQKEIKEYILSCCEKCHPYYEKHGIKKPVIKFRKMVSQWGSCNYEKGILTFNLNLMYAPKECAEYVVHHEFTHFLVHDHSKSFYTELEKVCPDWKTSREKLKYINVRDIK